MFDFHFFRSDELNYFGQGRVVRSRPDIARNLIIALLSQSGKAAAGIRGSAPDPSAPACSLQFESKQWRSEVSSVELLSIFPSVKLILPHALLKRTHFN